MTMEYRGYSGSVEFDSADRVFHGRVLGITSDMITFRGTSVDELERDFREAVDDYLALCAEDGIEPQRSYSGRFVLRLDPGLHGEVTAASRRAKTSMNKWIAGAIRLRLQAESAGPGVLAPEEFPDAAGG